MCLLQLVITDNVSIHVRAVISFDTDIFNCSFLIYLDSVACDSLNRYRELRVMDVASHRGTADDVDTGLRIQQDCGVDIRCCCGQEDVTCTVEGA